MKCCHLCRHILGVCQNRACHCHTFLFDDETGPWQTNHPDPTANTAIGRTHKQQRRKK